MTQRTHSPPPAAPHTDFDWDDVYRGEGSDTAAPDPYLPAPAESLAPGRALDLGCGTGGDALTEHGRHVTGVDASPRAIAGTRATACACGLDDRIELAIVDSATWRPETT
ncbi:methyltransferase domain-containing protein [Streptomyces sp. HNM0645]|uniref:SAM-dependent methyltransferase n=1 Tax=Streptomyces sp. HNM0645 TaxID=2782343 RepID=UPI0024B690CB|nr:methyltransferase domain-containing protein [Streptomyces sp. HNM0645]MDI9887087.1 methyltransferase domain-containing protein [Streptomyces sp. HNM0645]